MMSRRGFLGSAAVLASASVVSSRQAAAIPEAPRMDKATMQPPIVPSTGPDYQPVVTLNGWTLPWHMRREAINEADVTWRIDDLRIPLAGRWRVRVEILVSDFEKVALEEDVELPRAP